MRTIEPGDICEVSSCTHPATGLWIGSGGVLAASRSHMQHKWCECCILKAQLQHALSAAERSVALQAQLDKITCGGDAK